VKLRRRGLEGSVGSSPPMGSSWARCIVRVGIVIVV
jgi:hypothetical protein